jgi:hypothetical protein
MIRPKLFLSLQAAVVALIVVLILTAASAYAEKRAERSAKRFCSMVIVGEKADSLLQRAKSRGANDRYTQWVQISNDERLLPVTFKVFGKKSRHICAVKFSASVTSAEYVYRE